MPRFARYALLLPLPSAASAPIVIGGIVIELFVIRHAVTHLTSDVKLTTWMVHSSPVEHFEPLKFFGAPGSDSLNQPAAR